MMVYQIFFLGHFILEPCLENNMDKKVQDHEHLNMTTAPVKMLKVVIKVPKYFVNS